MRQSQSRAARLARNTGVMAGIDKRITGNVTIDGVTYTPASLKAVFSDESTAITTVEALHTQWLDQVLVTDAATAKASATYIALRTYLVGQYGKQANTVLNDFSMTVPKTGGTTTVTAKAAAVVKSNATRQVRNTGGSVQKKDQKGVIEVPVKAVTTIVPVEPSPAPTTTEPAAPAPAAVTKPRG